MAHASGTDLLSENKGTNLSLSHTGNRLRWKMLKRPLPTGPFSRTFPEYSGTVRQVPIPQSRARFSRKLF